MEKALETLATLLVGGAGGALFSVLGVPLPWMLGPLAACTVVGQFSSNIHVPRLFREILQPVLGVMLGSFFTPALVGQIAQWPEVIVSLVAYVLLAAMFGMFYFRRIAQYDLTTSFFCAVPGGISDLLVVGASMGANVIILGLIHTIRVLAVLFSIPLIVSLVTDAGGPAAGVAGQAAWDAVDIAVLAGCGLIGYGLSRVVRIPAGATLLPLLISAAVHILGLTESSPPAITVNAVQVVLGAYIGASLKDLDWRELRRAALHGVIWASGLVGIAASVAALCAWITGFGFPQLVLAFAPGGIAEMGLLTLTLGIDVALVTTCHVIRLFMVYLIVPIAARRIPDEVEKIKGAPLTDD